MRTQTAMKVLPLRLCAVMMAWMMALCTSAFAQAPGQDTITITKVPANQGGGGAAERAGKGLSERQDIPIGLKAKIARYTAVASNKAESLIDPLNIEQQIESAGFNKTCIQDVASNTNSSGSGAGRLGSRVQDQIVVLRGDMVNICR
ncbi:hypothetical protein [Variovorax sp. PCZ-1]|uniref:hypothetical protein n=1 Tax=Variovorax sp. PCZ-1 TaxID=2835533 RepID=UPI001BCEF942|nr:hypothetical protein [Variovorax sp. PCZ-1]MBS7808432.1 hypothetical protein [Variovorax sp. PCZ-1]